MNNKNDIAVLIERYFEGTTALEEEQILRDYFQTENVPEEWKIYQPLFQFFSGERKSKERNPKRRSLLLSLVGKGWGIGLVAAAASVFLVLSLRLAFNTNGTLPESSQAYIDGKKYTNIEFVQIEALKALENLSEEDDDVYSSQIEALDFFLENN
jgi:hypothetical protein